MTFANFANTMQWHSYLLRNDATIAAIAFNFCQDLAPKIKNCLGGPP